MSRWVVVYVSGQPCSSLRVKFSSITSFPRLHSTSQEPDLPIDDATLELWKCDQLENADALLIVTIPASRNQIHHALSSSNQNSFAYLGHSPRRCRKGPCCSPLACTDPDANLSPKAVEIQPSAIAYIAKSLAHVGNGDGDEGYRSCDIVFAHVHLTQVTFHLLIKGLSLRT